MQQRVNDKTIAAPAAVVMAAAAAVAAITSGSGCGSGCSSSVWTEFVLCAATVESIPHENYDNFNIGVSILYIETIPCCT